MDTFHPITDFDGYFINKLGVVLSKMKCKTGRLIKSGLNGNGYYNLTLYKDKKRKVLLVHRILALTFIPNPENLPCVDHIDICKTNNNLNNLRWASPELNMQNRNRQKNNKVGHKHINLWIDKRNDNEWYRFQIIRNGKKHEKKCKTLEETIKYRNEYLTNLGEEIID